MDQFVLLADESNSVPDLQGKSYADFHLLKKDWQKVELMHEVLQVRKPFSSFLHMLIGKPGTCKCAANILKLETSDGLPHHPHPRVPPDILGKHVSCSEVCSSKARAR